MLPLAEAVERRRLFAVFLLIFLAIAFYLVNVPPGIQQEITGAELPQKIETASELGSVWRPLAASPNKTWASMMSLATPLAVVLLAVQLTRRDIYRSVLVVVAISALSGFLGVLQAAGGADSALYFYGITNQGSPVGLFANRNHAALLLACLFPMLAFYASSTGSGDSDQTRRRFIACSISITVVPLILITGSRFGVLLLVVGMAGAALLYRTRDIKNQMQKEWHSSRKGAFLAFTMLVSVGILTYFFARAEALDRLFFETQNSASRQDFWAISSNLFWQYLPFGSGAGSYADMYLIVEPERLLGERYLNRAHNDWIETAVTFGALGASGLLLAVVFFAIRNWTVWWKMDGRRRSVAMSRLGGVVILLIALASFADYPLRTPTIMSLFALSSVWLSEATRYMHPHTLTARD